MAGYGLNLDISGSSSAAADNSGDFSVTGGGSGPSQTMWIVIGAVALVALVFFLKGRK